MSEGQGNTGPDRLPVNDPLAFVEHRAATGKPPEYKFDAVGDHLAGIVTEVEEIEGQYGTYKEISIIARDQTEHRFRAFGEVLARKCSKVKKGDVLGVRREEDGYSPEYKTEYRVYEVFIEQPSEDAPRGALAPSPTSARALRHSPEIAQVLEEAFGDEDDAEDDVDAEDDAEDDAGL
jgi:hypothetical protein